MITKRKKKKLENVREVYQDMVKDDYTCGFYNGIELCLSILNDTEPQYMAAVSESEERIRKTEQRRTGIHGKRMIGG